MGKSPHSSRRIEPIGSRLFVATQAAQNMDPEQLQPLGLYARGWGVLSTLAESGPLTQIELATALAIDRTAMVYLLDELEQSGLVERVRNPDDRRSFLIHLTGDGQRRQRNAATALAGAADTLLRPLDPEERGLLRALLTRIVDHWQALSAAQP